MHRRAALASLASALAGCSLAPGGPSTAGYPTSGPNLFVSFAWDLDQSALTVRFDRGSRVTAANTNRLAVVTPEADAETVWVADGTASAAEFPLTPGATVTHDLPQPADTRLVWEAPDRNASRAVAVWRPETGTPEADA
jgi:hypothetical protein